MTPRDGACQMDSDRLWLAVRVSCVWRVKKRGIGKEVRQSITNSRHRVNTPVVGNDSTACRNKNLRANQNPRTGSVTSERCQIQRRPSRQLTAATPDDEAGVESTSPAWTYAAGAVYEMLTNSTCSDLMPLDRLHRQLVFLYRTIDDVCCCQSSSIEYNFIVIE